jgi:hypothetical protein
LPAALLQFDGKFKAAVQKNRSQIMIGEVINWQPDMMGRVMPCVLAGAFWVQANIAINTSNAVYDRQVLDDAKRAIFGSPVHSMRVGGWACR